MLNPLHDNVIVKVSDEAFQNSVGLYVSILRSDIATVVAVGPGAYKYGSLVPMSLSFGQKVIIDPDMGHAIFHDGKKHLILHESDILAVVQE